MANLAGIYSPSTSVPTKIAALAATTASSVVTFNTNALLAITASGTVQVVFGQSSNIPTADATGWLIAAGSVAEFNLGNAFDSVAFYNPGGSAVDIYIYLLVP